MLDYLSSSKTQMLKHYADSDLSLTKEHLLDQIINERLHAKANPNRRSYTPIQMK